MRPLPARATVASVALLAVGLVGAQSPTTPSTGAKPPTDTLYFSTNVGSFKFLPPGPEKTTGTFDFDFEGTVMVSGLTGTVTPGPGVRLELERMENDHNRRVYFGKGHIHIDGEYRAVQFFGRNLKGNFHGVSVARLYGEFDKNQETGYFWYASNPEKIDWGSYGHTVVCPPGVAPVGAKVKGKVKDVPHRGGVQS